MTNNSDQAPDRRGFVKRMVTAGIGAVVMLPAIGAGIRMFFDPLRRKGGGGEPVFVATVSALPDPGKSRRFQVISTRVDAWNRVTEPIGSVFLRKKEDGNVQALNASCPHAGCSVDFARQGEGYACPCHDSLFKLDGERANESSPSPRGLDELEVDVRNGEIWVRFQNFRAGEAHKIPLV